MENTYILVPMAGQGKRFRRAGFDTYKPFIPIQGKPMIAHVMDKFPESIGRIVITCRELLTEEQEHYLTQSLGCTVIFISPHTEGPAYSILQASAQLPQNASFFLSYCDITWEWTEADMLAATQSDGVVYTHRGFHPHLIKNNYSAFCLPDPEDPHAMLRIQEKASYTDDWMKEPVSIGLFYIKDGNAMLSAAQSLVEDDERVSAEFFPSLLFNRLKDRGLEIRLRDLPYYIHWGVPSQLSDFSRWEQVVTAACRPTCQSEVSFTSNVMCMAGEGRRMRAIDNVGKAFLPVMGAPMWEFVSRQFTADSLTCIVAPGAEASVGAPHHVFPLKAQTTSQAQTLIEALPLLRESSDFFLTSCDAYGLIDAQKLRDQIDAFAADAVVFTFTPSMTQEKITSNYTHVQTDGPWISDIFIKSGADISNVGLAGFFWVRDGRIFDSVADMEQDPDHEMCADHMFRHFVKSGKRVLHFLVDQYVHLGTPEEYEEFQYWTQRQFLFAQ